MCAKLSGMLFRAVINILGVVARFNPSTPHTLSNKKNCDKIHRMSNACDFLHCQMYSQRVVSFMLLHNSHRSPSPELYCRLFLLFSMFLRLGRVLPYGLCGPRSHDHSPASSLCKFWDCRCVPLCPVFGNQNH